MKVFIDKSDLKLYETAAGKGNSVVLSATETEWLVVMTQEMVDDWKGKALRILDETKPLL